MLSLGDMETRECSKCKVIKDIQDFYVNHTKEVNGEVIEVRRKDCKVCHTKRTNQYYYDKYYNDYISVYYLPEEHYVGISNHYELRLMEHARAGKIIDGAEEIARFERAVDAHYLETLLHMRGYNGFQFK